ncbi:skin secretory protein xP2-like [Seriola lalandi dorsalis]|uniref:skin secretory protein xP2-like n=1 Tax=Seriola lalandi dorsalis TaxID=1841481 RepID=UPI000C6FC681|nr:skin secretory protein xP2-like [Seriola lalandi dorsalis]
MMLGLTLRVSWICLLLRIAAGFPATKGDYKYPYTAIGSPSGSSGSSNFPSGGSFLPQMSEPEAPAQQPSSPARFVAPGVAFAPLSYERNTFIRPYDSSADGSSKAPGVPSQGAGYASPPVFAPVSPLQPQPGSGTVGNLGSYAKAPALRIGDGPMPYGSRSEGASPMAYGSRSKGASPMAYGSRSSASSPTLRFGDGPMPYGSHSSSSSPALRFGDGPMPYGSHSSSSSPALRFGDGPMPYGSHSSAGSPLRDVQPAGEAYISFPLPDAQMASRPFPDWSVLEANAAAPDSQSETSPLPPSSYIIQSSDGYQQANVFLSHMKYSPEYLPPPEIKAPSKLPPMSRSKGVKAYRG